MRVAIAQISSTADPSENLAAIRERAGEAARDGASLVVFPEAAMCRFGVPLGPVAEPLDGPWATAVRELAASLGVTIVAGMFTPGSGGRVRNTMLVTGPDGDAAYDKIHLYDAFGFRESDTVEAGSEPLLVTVDGADVGITTCYDIRFPALFQALGDRDAAVIVVSASWGAGPGKVEQWRTLAAARALDSGAYVVACDQADPASIGVDTGTAPTGVGNSLVAGPLGDVVGSLDAAPGLLVLDLDLDRVGAARTATGVLANRKPIPNGAR